MRKAIIFTIILAAASVTSLANIKVKAKQSMSGQSYENTTYIKGKRQRTDSMGGKMINLTQCDLRRAIQMNPETKTFIVNEFGEVATATGTKSATTNQPITKGGKIISTITIKDTGERKQMFGYTARHLIITMDNDSTPDACSRSKNKMETDGWYIDFDFAFDCDQTAAYRPAPSAKNGGCQDKYESKTIGSAKRGFAVYEKMTFWDEFGKETMSMVNEVVELSKAALDAALFEVPADYREVQDAAQLYASASQTYSDTGAGSTNGGGSSGSSLQLPNPGSGSAATTSLGEKKVGTIRIGLATVKTGAVGEGVTAADLSSAVQNTLIAFLKMPNVEVVSLEARLPSAIDAEAAEKECDFVVHANVSHKKGGGGFGKMFGGALSSAVSMAGVGGGTGGYVASQIASQAISTATVAGQMKVKDEVTLDVKMTRTGGVQAFAKAFKAKAKSNGEDIISQAVEQAAIGIAENIGK